uniref:Uncharacterized protein n=1 Tax=Strongyloides papillosus TaxID=174720 RepID=A0A0N5B7X0_STREA
MGKIVKADKKKWNDVEVDGKLLKDPEFANLVSVEESCDEPATKKSKKDVGKNDMKKGSGSSKNKDDEYFDDYVNEELANQDSSRTELERKNGSENKVGNREENKNEGKQMTKDSGKESEEISDEELEDEELDGEESDREIDEELEGEEVFDEEIDEEAEADEEETDQ